MITFSVRFYAHVHPTDTSLSYKLAKEIVFPGVPNREDTVVLNPSGEGSALPIVDIRWGIRNAPPIIHLEALTADANRDASFLADLETVQYGWKRI